MTDRFEELEATGLDSPEEAEDDEDEEAEDGEDEEAEDDEDEGFGAVSSTVVMGRDMRSPPASTTVATATSTRPATTTPAHAPVCLVRVGSASATCAQEPMSSTESAARMLAPPTPADCFEHCFSP